MTDIAAHDQAKERRVSGFSIAALVLGLLGFLVLPIPLAVVLGLIALVRALRPPSTAGSGARSAKTVSVVFSLVGILAAALWSLGWSAAIAIVHMESESASYALEDVSRPVQDADPSISAGDGRAPASDACEPSPGHATVCTLEAGDCFIESPSTDFYEVELTPCDEPHNAQVIGSYSPPGGDWPGWSSFNADVDSVCRPMSEEALDPAREPNGYFIGFLAPDEVSWNAGVQQAHCYVSTGGESWTTTLM